MIYLCTEMKGSMSQSLCLILLLLHQISVSRAESFEVLVPSEPIVAVAGEDIVLPCYLNPRISAMDMRVEWSRVPSTGPVVHNYQEGQIRNENQMPSYKGRTALSPLGLITGDASLRLTGVRASDEGRYQCYIESESSYDGASFQVQIKGTEPVISMEVPHRAGWVSLLCESKGWATQPDLVWLDSEGHSLPAGATETHRDSEDLYTMRRRIIIQDRDTNTATCRVHLQQHKLEKETAFNITAEMFPAPRWKASSAVFLPLVAAALIGCAVLTQRYKKLCREQVEEIKTALRSGTLWDKQLEPDQCSTLAYVLLTGEVLDEFDLKMYKTSAADRQRLVRVVRNCKKAQLDSCGLTEKSCEIVASALQSPNSPLRELDLRYNNLGDSGVELLCAGLKSPNCNLQRLDLSYNNLGDSGVKLLCVELKSPNCKLQTLGLDGGNLTKESCEIVASALQSPDSPLRELDLSNNNLEDSGVELLCAGLKSPNCKLHRLGLYGGNLTQQSCESVASALQSPNSPLRELDLSYNNLGDTGVKLLCAGLKSPNCKLQKLGLGWCNLTEGCCDDLASVLHSPHSELIDLELRDNELQDSGVRALSAGLEDPHCKLQRLGLSGCQVTERGCDSLASALRSNPSHLRELDLSYNHPGDSGVRALSAAKLDALTLLVDHGGESRNKPGPRKYGCQLTLDPNTAHRELSLSEGNRKVTQGREEQPYPDHPERFDWWPQVVCRESLSERCYWEAEWSVPEWSVPERGWVYIAVTYKDISRKGWSDDCLFGLNKNSWSLDCSKHRYSVWHNGKEIVIPVPPSPYCSIGVCDDGDGEGVCVYRVGVYVDRPAGTLSFNSISDADTLTLLYRFHTSFTEHKPLCAGFYVRGVIPSVSLCQLE